MITPPLIDSKMYLLSSEEVWEKPIPDFAVISSSCGTSRFVHFGDLAPGGGGGGVGCPIPWPWIRSTVNISTTKSPALIPNDDRNITHPFYWNHPALRLFGYVYFDPDGNGEHAKLWGGVSCWDEAAPLMVAGAAIEPMLCAFGVCAVG